MTRVPWRTIFTHAPTIVDAARSFYGLTRKTAEDAGASERSGGGVDTLRVRVARLEQREVEQAALIADLAKHVQELTSALEVLRRRLQLVVVAGSAAVVVSLLAGALALWHGR